jgi:ATP-dependent helicase/nuclease subunit A
MSLTPAQERAVAARGNVLVVAGAGTGKTRTLVERCLNCLFEEQPPVSIDEVLMATFTEAAAAEMRQRIRARLEEQLEKEPDSLRWSEQLALFETAHIGTLHGFCLQLVRQHFYQLELDPQLTVLAEEESRMLAEETLDAILERHYAGRDARSEAVQRLIQIQGQGWDAPIKALVLRLHNYSQSLPDPRGWFERQSAIFGSPIPTAWRRWLEDGSVQWRARWLPELLASAPLNEVAAECLAALHDFGVSADAEKSVAALGRIASARQLCPRGKKGQWLKPFEEFFADAAFLASLMARDGGDPLAEDWAWTRSSMETLLELGREFARSFAEAKRELGRVDFHDLEQHALRVLWDTDKAQPTRTALEWRRKLRFVFVDEYQDINAAQDKIIEAVSREAAQANRFLVGDLKQSIYRFRLANPRIFQNYMETWRPPRGETIPLVENFRSRATILEFANSLFALLMRREIGGVVYDDEARLRPGLAQEGRASAPEEGQSDGVAKGPRVELHWRVRGRPNQPGSNEEAEEETADIADLDETDKEARLIAWRLRELRNEGWLIWEDGRKCHRPVEWSDMAILLRSPSSKAQNYAKEFARLDVPLAASRGGFYESTEISDLLSLLQLLDNPLQDLPLLAVLHSPLAGLGMNELARIRLAAKGHYWHALHRWAAGRGQGPQTSVGVSPASAPPTAAEKVRPDPGLPTGQTERKVAAFLERYARWRRLARRVSLSRCLEAVLLETHYSSWLLAQPRGEQRYANVQRLLTLAQRFDQFQRQSLFRFLRFVEAQQFTESEPEVASATQENAVRLLSIHQSKGLEFPVVVVADLGKPFNTSDLSAPIILDEVYGVCPQIKPPHTGKRYPSLPYWLARRRQKQELLGEELRLLYVAVTRARDLLILSGSITQAKLGLRDGVGVRPAPSSSTSPSMTAEDVRTDRDADSAPLGVIASARCYSDWLGAWFVRNVPRPDAQSAEGHTSLVRWFIHDDQELAESARRATLSADIDGEPAQVGSAVWDGLRQRLSWTYPFAAATLEPAKTSVTLLRRRAADTDELQAATVFPAKRRGVSRRPDYLSEHASGGEPAPTPSVLQPQLPGLRPALSAHPSAREVGSATHLFLQFVSIERTLHPKELRQEAARMQREGILTEEETHLLDFDGLAAFWKSEIGRAFRRQREFLHRELPFTARFSPEELARLAGEPVAPGLSGEFVIVQGLADMAVVGPEEVWLVDFKTDALKPGQLSAKVEEYAPQVRLYASALSRIYNRPVTGAWLFFLSCRTAAAVGIEGLAA